MSETISEPIPISLISGRYLLFDINVVTYLRRTYHICGVLIGSIPQAPQQNVFLGLPIELMPEEAKILVEKEAAYIVDDKAWHTQNFSSIQGLDRKRYLESLRAEGVNAKKAAVLVSRKKTENALAKQAAAKRALKSSEISAESHLEDTSEEPVPLEADAQGVTLFNDERPSSPASTTSTTLDTPTHYAITPTTSYQTSSLPQNPSSQPPPPVPKSYSLFSHLHSRDYFVMPGLRFGCDYNVYPGDPLRFHSHFLAVGFDWEQEIPLLDIVGGGRLGTAVKKGFLLGGENPDGEVVGGDKVRTFCVEWGGM